jgi:hypothetical protein
MYESSDYLCTGGRRTLSRWETRMGGKLFTVNIIILLGLELYEYIIYSNTQIIE